ncbi:MAG TPA: beta-phosphoglucomutase family hydrolase [Streptosporangiaceae bacterium]|jgi:beta-phosphoglucomutase family hydrolase
MPDTIRACLFDLDGVLTKTDVVHAAAWQEMFDSYLRQRATRTDQRFTPFDLVTDYGRYLDGRPRVAGVRSFLASRAITLPEGGPDDSPDQSPGTETVHGLGNRKNALLRRRIAADGVIAYPGSVRYLRAAAAAGLHRAVVSSSANCRAVLAAAGLDGDFEVIVDAQAAQREQLRGKPAPDTYLFAASALGAAPGAAAVFEDAQAGVAAGKAGKFGYVVGIDRIGQADVLRAEGADTVVTDLDELLDGP